MNAEMAAGGHLVAPAVVSRYGKGTDSDATDAMVVGTVRSHMRPGSNSSDVVVNALDRRGDGADDNEAQAGQLIAGALGGGNDGAGRRSEFDPNLVTTGAVRRLTPVECERLQGLPDGWTLEHGPSLADEPNFPHRTDESCPPPDSRRYAACGDAVTANVAEWIGRRLL